MKRNTRIRLLSATFVVASLTLAATSASNALRAQMNMNFNLYPQMNGSGTGAMNYPFPPMDPLSPGDPMMQPESGSGFFAPNPPPPPPQNPNNTFQFQPTNTIPQNGQGWQQWGQNGQGSLQPGMQNGQTQMPSNGSNQMNIPSMPGNGNSGGDRQPQNPCGIVQMQQSNMFLPNGQTQPQQNVLNGVVPSLGGTSGNQGTMTITINGTPTTIPMPSNQNGLVSVPTASVSSIGNAGGFIGMGGGGQSIGMGGSVQPTNGLGTMTQGQVNTQCDREIQKTQRDITRTQGLIDRIGALLGRWQAQVDRMTDAGQQQSLQDKIDRYDEMKLNLEIHLDASQGHLDDAQSWYENYTSTNSHTNTNPQTGIFNPAGSAPNFSF